MSVQQSHAEDDEPQQERLVLFADLVESVRLMQQQEGAVIRRWRGFSGKVRADIAPRHSGRVVRTAGDALLLTFVDAQSALRAAFELHESLALDQQEVEPEHCLLLRIGLHRTLCLVDEHDAYGAGVNITARLASLAQPGETIVSTEVRCQLHEGVHADFEDLGPRYLKHLDSPLRAFRAFRTRAPGQAPRPLQPRAPQAEAIRPLLAILPFRPVPADARLDVMGYLMADALNAALSRHPQLRPIARASLTALQYEPLDADHLRHLEAKLGAAYLLSGHYYRYGEKLQLHLELCALPSAQLLWSEAVELKVDALFHGQDDMVPLVCARLGELISAHELQGLRRLPLNSLPAYSLYLGACGLMNSLLPSDFLRARKAFEHLAERHPRHAAPLAMLARWHVTNDVQSWSSQDGYTRARALAEQALERDPQQPTALCALALTSMNADRDLARAHGLNKAALHADPSEALAWTQLAAVLAFQDQGSAALEAAEQALRVSPLDPQRYLLETYAALAALASGEPALSVAWAQRSLHRQLLHAPSHRLLVAGLWLVGQQQAAQVALQRFARVCPQAFASGVWRMDGAPAWRQTYEMALAEAGMRH